MASLDQLWAYAAAGQGRIYTPRVRVAREDLLAGVEYVKEPFTIDWRCNRIQQGYGTQSIVRVGAVWGHFRPEAANVRRRVDGDARLALL